MLSEKKKVDNDTNKRETNKRGRASRFCANFFLCPRTFPQNRPGILLLISWAIYTYIFIYIYMGLTVSGFTVRAVRYNRRVVW